MSSESSSILGTEFTRFDSSGHSLLLLFFILVVRLGATTSTYKYSNLTDTQVGDLSSLVRHHQPAFLFSLILFSWPRLDLPPITKTSYFFFLSFCKIPTIDSFPALVDIEQIIRWHPRDPPVSRRNLFLPIHSTTSSCRMETPHVPHDSSIY